MNTLDLRKPAFIAEKSYKVKRRTNWITIYLAILFLVFGTIFLAVKSPMFIFLYLGGLGSLFTTTEMRIYPEQNKVQHYLSIFGYKIENLCTWYHLDDFSFILVSAASTTYNSGFESIMHEVYLYSNDKNRQPNLLITEFGNREEAIEEANRIGELIKFNVKINKFN